MEELESRVRNALERRADRAEVDPTAVGRAMREAARRRRARWGVGAVAAAALVVAGVAVGVPLLPDDTTGGGSVATDPDAAENGTGWRTEHWGDLAVDVPADWGYGSAPAASGDERVICHDRPGDGPGYVGRPVMLSDVCELYPPIPNSTDPTEPYAWLGGEVEPGVVPHDNGMVQETVETHGTTLTVATRDAALRKRILDSARGGEMCMSELEEDVGIMHDRAEDPSADVVLMRACVYRRVEPDEPLAILAAAAELGPEQLAAYQRALDGAAPAQDPCPTVDLTESQEWVVLELLDAGGSVLRQDVIDRPAAALHGDGLSCGGVDVAADDLRRPLEVVPLTRELIDPWLFPAATAVLPGPQG